MKRPLLPVALCYAGGILAADFVVLPWVWLLTAEALLLAAALLWGRARPWLLGLALVFAGAANLTLRTAIISPSDLRILVPNPPALALLRGILLETPSLRVYERDEVESWRTMALVELQAVRLGKQTHWTPASGVVAATTSGVLASDFFDGEGVEVSGILHAPKPAVAEGLFDYASYLRRQEIYYQLQVAGTNDWKALAGRAAGSGAPIADRFTTWAQRTLALGLPVQDEPLRLLWAMTLGWKTALTGEVSKPFMRSGTMHIFAISGLHIALIAAILVAVLRVARVPRSACGLLVVPLIWCYTGVTGWQASAIRSTVMMTIVITGWSLKRPSDLLNSLAAAAFVILLWQPQQLFQASFQLSFFVVLSLALFSPTFDALRRRLLEPDPMLPARLRPRWRQWLDQPLYYISVSITTSIAAWLGSIPLVAFYFHLFTPVSLLSNLIVVPLSSLALSANLASLVVGGWFPWCAELFNHSAWLFMMLMILISEWAARIPGGWWHVGTPSVITFVLYYAVLVVWLAGWWTRPRTRPWALAMITLLSVLWLVQWQRERGTTRVTILPVGGGAAICFDAPGGREDLLLDAGSESAAGFVVEPFLRAQGINHLERLILTHGDLKHVGGAELVRTNFGVREVLTSSARFRSPAYRRLMDWLDRSPELRRHIHRGDAVDRWRVLHPESIDRFAQADDLSLVLHGNIGDTRLLFLSDLGRPGQNALLARTKDLRADIVVAGLPAQGEPLCAALLEAIRPRVIIVTDAEFPATERARPALRERLAERNLPVIYTRTAGAVTIEFRGGGWELRTRDGTILRGKGEQ